MTALLSYHSLNSVSYDALDQGLALDARQSGSSTTVSLITRICIWLRLVWQGRDTDVIAVYELPAPIHNRATGRLLRRRIPAARQGNPLAAIFYRTYGRAYYLRWIYDYTLTCRVRWCFTKWNWKWDSRIFYKTLGCQLNTIVCCNALLFPD